MKTSPDGILKKMEWKLLMHYLGKENAHHRFDLLAHCKVHFPDLSDRQMRKIYSESFCIGHNRKGIYLIDDPQEIDKMIGLMRKKVDSYEEKMARFELQKQRLIKRREAEQLLLFRRA